MRPPSQAIAAIIQSAEGWLELGDVAEALRELEKIPSSACNLAVLRLRYTAFAMINQWQAALLVAEVAVQLYPSAPEPWLWRAEAIRATTGSAEKACASLLPAVQLFPDNTAVEKALIGYKRETSDPGAEA